MQCEWRMRTPMFSLDMIISTSFLLPVSSEGIATARDWEASSHWKSLKIDVPGRCRILKSFGLPLGLSPFTPQQGMSSNVLRAHVKGVNFGGARRKCGFLYPKSLKSTPSPTTLSTHHQIKSGMGRTSIFDPSLQTNAYGVEVHPPHPLPLSFPTGKHCITKQMLGLFQGWDLAVR